MKKILFLSLVFLLTLTASAHRNDAAGFFAAAPLDVAPYNFVKYLNDRNISLNETSLYYEGTLNGQKAYMRYSYEDKKVSQFLVFISNEGMTRKKATSVYNDIFYSLIGDQRFIARGGSHPMTRKTIIPENGTYKAQFRQKGLPEGEQKFIDIEVSESRDLYFIKIRCHSTVAQ